MAIVAIYGSHCLYGKQEGYEIKQRGERMKKVEHYICEVCGTEYKDKKRCADCEKGHIKPVEIYTSKYLSLDKNAKGYPSSINIKMEDGNLVTYKR